jgi:hypothetical protein
MLKQKSREYNKSRQEHVYNNLEHVFFPLKRVFSDFIRLDGLDTHLLVMKIIIKVSTPWHTVT